MGTILPFLVTVMLGIGAVVAVYGQPVPPNPQPTQDTNVNPVKEQHEDAAFTLENSLSLRDPFRKYTPKVENGEDTQGPIADQLKFELDKFKLIGVINGPRKNKAMLATPEGKMVIVTEKDQLGVRKGLVTKIGPGLLTVEEKIVNLLGQEEKVETVIEMSEGQEK
jgi:Tfp pilus assembly protein PilP